jgi:hypothetical protein
MNYVESEDEVYPNYEGLNIKKINDVGARYLFNNIKIGEGKEVKEFLGYWYVIAAAPYYGHYIQEVLAPFLYYKKYIDNNIKLLWVDNIVPEGTDGHVMNSVHSAVKELLKENITSEVSHDEWHANSHKFEYLVTFFNSSRFIPMFNSKNFIITDVYQHNNTLLNKCLQEFFSLYKVIDANSNKKIFISRRKRSKLIEQFNDSGSLIRHSPEWYHDALESYFEGLGYSIHELSGMFVGDQVKLFYNATHIAGISGVGILNSIFCRGGTKIHSILSNPSYNYPWEKDILPVVDVNYNYIDLAKVSNEKELTDQLDNYFNKGKLRGPRD